MTPHAWCAHVKLLDVMHKHAEKLKKLLQASWAEFWYLQSIRRQQLLRLGESHAGGGHEPDDQPH